MKKKLTSPNLHYRLILGMTKTRKKAMGFLNVARNPVDIAIGSYYRELLPTIIAFHIYGTSCTYM